MRIHNPPQWGSLLEKVIAAEFSGPVWAFQSLKMHWGREEDALNVGHLLEATAVPQILGLSPSSDTAWRGNLDYSCLSPP